MLLEFADALGVGDDTVRNLRDAYLFFELLMRDESDSEPIRNLRRKHPYTRWTTVYRQWKDNEFELSEARDWLENFVGGNEALYNEIENKHGAPEWERRSYTIYREAYKLQNDFGVPDKLQKAAGEYVKEYDVVFPKVKKWM